MEGSLKVVSWNVNSIKIRLPRLLAFLERESPDIVCLQELKCMEENFPYEALSALGYHCTVMGQKTYNGVALLSREKPENPIKGLPGEPIDPAARLVGAQVRGIQVFNLYAPNGQEVGSEKYAYKLGWYERLEKFLSTYRAKEQNILVCGDFNVAPDDRDVHDPKAWEEKILCSSPEREALKRLISLGLSDTFRLHHSTGGNYSWWDYRQLAFPRNLGLRIDLILATPQLLDRCTDAWIDREERKGTQPSDHAPVLANFVLG